VSYKIEQFLILMFDFRTHSGYAVSMMGSGTQVRGAQPHGRKFPEQEIISTLERWWDDEVEDDPFAETDKKGTLYDLLPTLDSLTALNALLGVEEHLGFKLPVTVVKRGGYKTRQQMIEHLVPRIRRIFEAQNK
jgi:hypothetical protein